MSMRWILWTFNAMRTSGKDLFLLEELMWLCAVIVYFGASVESKCGCFFTNDRLGLMGGTPRTSYARCHAFTRSVGPMCTGKVTCVPVM